LIEYKDYFEGVYSAIIKKNLFAHT